MLSFLVGIGFQEIFLILLVFVLPFVAWVWAVIDILRSDFKDANGKITWLLVIIFVPLLGWFLYLLIGRKQRIRVG